MSDRNVKLIRRFFEAFNARDVEAWIAFFDPSAEFHSVFAAVSGAVYHGYDGLRKYFRDMADAWGDEIRAEPETYFDLGEHTLTFALFHGRGRHSGADVAMPIALLATWREDLIVYMKGTSTETKRCATSASPRTRWSRSSRERIAEPGPRALDLRGLGKRRLQLGRVGGPRDRVCLP